MIEESVVYQDILRRGEERGRERWFGEGEKSGEKKLLLLQLNQRFGPLQVSLCRQIEQLSIASLEKLGTVLFSLQDLKELRAWLRKHKDSA